MSLMEDPPVKALVNEASMNIPELNNFIITLSKPLRQSRTRVFNHLTRKLKQLRSSKKPSEVAEKKIANLLQEIEEIKAIKLDNKVIKQLLAKKFSEKDLSRAETPTERVLTRLALQKGSFNDAVSKFRKDHEDWIELTEFMLSKNGGRRFKKRNAKVSVEKLAKKTLDTADERARELYVQNDQRHQHNSRPVAVNKRSVGVETAVKPGYEEAVVVDNAEEEKTEEKPEEVSDKPANNWLATIFKKKSEDVEVETETKHGHVNVENVNTAHKRKETRDESVVVKLVPEMLKKTKKNDEEETLALPINQNFLVSKKTVEPVVEKEQDIVEDFFMSLTDGNDEISKSGGQSLTAHDIGGANEVVEKRRGSRNFDRKQAPKFSVAGKRKGPLARSGPRQFSKPEPNRSAGNAQQSNEKLHASWEARRAQRNQQQIKIPQSGHSAVNKRTTFNSDDEV